MECYVTTATVNLQIPMETLVSAIAALDLDAKRQLLDLLEDWVFASEDAIEHDPIVLAEVEASRQAVAAGDYQTLQSYLLSQSA
jgi:cephalosporin hydroxylase